MWVVSHVLHSNIKYAPFPAEIITVCFFSNNKWEKRGQSQCPSNLWIIDCAMNLKKKQKKEKRKKLQKPPKTNCKPRISTNNRVMLRTIKRKVSHIPTKRQTKHKQLK